MTAADWVYAATYVGDGSKLFKSTLQPSSGNLTADSNGVISGFTDGVIYKIRFYGNFSSNSGTSLSNWYFRYGGANIAGMFTDRTVDRTES